MNQRFYEELLQEIKEIKEVFVNAWEILDAFTKDPKRQMESINLEELKAEQEEINETKKRFIEVEKRRAEIEEERNKIEQDRVALQKAELEVIVERIAEEQEKLRLEGERNTLEKERLGFEKLKENEEVIKFLKGLKISEEVSKALDDFTEEAEKEATEEG